MRKLEIFRKYWDMGSIAKQRAFIQTLMQEISVGQKNRTYILTKMAKK